jgi:O-antigen ligase/polysaccharide polymerase Wzy-like membrane protein
MPSLTSARRRSSAVFVGAVVLTMTLSVVAFVEPSPGDIGIAILLTFGTLFGKLAWHRFPTLPLLLLSLLGFASFVSFFYASDLKFAMSFSAITLFMVTLWLFTMGFVTRYEDAGIRALMTGFTAGGVFSVSLSLLAYFGILSKLSSGLPLINSLQMDDTVLFFGERIRGLFKDPNVFGPYLVVVAGYATIKFRDAKGFARTVFWISTCGISSVGVLLCFSRAAWANYVVTMVVLFTLDAITRRDRTTPRRKLGYLMIVAIVAAAAVVYTLKNPRVNQFASGRSEMQDYDEGRFDKQAEALQLGLRNPLGIGPGQSHIILGYSPHSLPLGLFAENGVIGLLAFMTFTLATLIRSLVLAQKVRHQFQRQMFALVAAALTGTLVNSLVIDPIHWRHFWILLALGWMPVFINIRTTAASSRSAISRRAGGVWKEEPCR